MLRPFIVHKMDHLLIYLDFFLREEHSTSKIRLNLNRESLTNPPEHFFNKQILSKSTFLDKPIDSYFIQKENIKPNNTLNFCSKMIRLWAAEKVVLPLMHEADLCQNEFSTLSNQFARTCCDTLQINSISKETLLSSYLRSLKTNFGFAREVMTAKSNLAARLSRVFGFTAAPAHKTALRHVYNDLKDFKHGDSGLNLITKNFVLNAFAEKISSNKKSPVLYDLKQLQSFKSEVAIVKTDDEHFVVAVRKHSDAFQSMNQFESRLGPFRLRDFGDNVLQAIATYLILAKEIKNQNVALVMKEINNVFGDLST